MKRSISSIFAAVALFAAASLLSACSTVMMVDSEVRSYATQPAIPAGATYRFERLPSQLGNSRQTLLESFTENALGKVGLRRDDAAAQYSVQVSEGLIRENRAPWNDPWRQGMWSGSVQLSNHGSGVGLWFPMYPFPDPPWYVREVSLILRNLTSAKVVYETGAVNHGPAAHSDAVLPAMLEAALRDFPNPPQGARRINIEAPRNP